MCPEWICEWTSEWFSEWMTFICHLLFDRPLLWSLSLSKPVLVKRLKYLNCVSQELVQICSAFNCYVVQVSPHSAWVFFRNHPFISIFVTGHYYEASCWFLRLYIDYCLGFTFEGPFVIHAWWKGVHLWVTKVMFMIVAILKAQPQLLLKNLKR